MPAAQAFIRDHKLNEAFPGELDDIGIIVMGGLTNGVLRALERLGLADVFGASRVPLLRAQRRLSAGAGGDARASAPASARCWWSRKAIPNTSSRRSTSSCAAPTSRPACSARDVLPKAGEYTSEVLLDGPRRASSPQTRPAGVDADALAARGPRHCSAHRPRGARGARRVCRRGRRPSAPAARSGRCSAPSSCCSARSGRPISAPTSAAIRSRPCRRSASAIRSSATA